MNWFPSGLSLFLEGEPWTVVSRRGREGGVFYLCNVVSIMPFSGGKEIRGVKLKGVCVGGFRDREHYKVFPYLRYIKQNIVLFRGRQR